MDAALASLVRRRARAHCEYCQLAERLSAIAFEIDHVVAQKHGGATDAENLALSCFYCNSFKGPNIAGIDPDSGKATRLYHPRRDSWNQHFAWQGPRLRGRTRIGRTTIAVLSINHPDALAVRAALLEEGVFPPAF